MLNNQENGKGLEVSLNGSPDCSQSEDETKVTGLAWLVIAIQAV